jgi:HEAT repeat protein
MWENLLRVDWARLTHAYGRARDVPKILRNMISPNKKVQSAGWYAFWGSLNHQGDFYDSTVAAIPFLIEAVASTDTPCRAGILDSFRQRWLDAPEYGGDPLVEEPPGGTDEPTPMLTEVEAKDLSVDEPGDEAEDEEIDIESYRRMDLCAWQTGRAILAGRSTYERLLNDPDREVAAAAAALLQLWPETRRIAKRTLIQAIKEEPEPVEQGRRILEFGVYADDGDVATLESWVASNRPAEMRAAAALTWAWMVNPEPVPEPAAAAFRDCSTPRATAFAKLPWVGVFPQGPWSLPATAAELILRLTENQDKETRWRAVQGLNVRHETAKHLTAARVVPLLIKCLSDRYNRIRDAAAYALSQRAESVLEIDPTVPRALIAALETSKSPDWGDGHSGLDNGASTCGHAARLLATLSHRLDASERKQALAGIERAIRRFAGKDSTVMFDSMGIQTPQFLKEQLGPLQKPTEWGVPELLESLAYPTKQDRRLSCAECDRRLADLYSRAPKITIEAAVKVVRDASNRDAAIGAALWLMTLGPAAEPALRALDEMATGKLDGYAESEVKDAAEFIQKSISVEPEVSLERTSKSGRQRVALLTGTDLSGLDRLALIAELNQLLVDGDAYVRAGSAELLAKLQPAAREAPGSVRLLEMMLTDDAAACVGITGKFEFEARIYHWRQERRAPRVSALRALFAMDQAPKDERVFKAMLSESVHAATIMAQRTVPHRFSIGQWRLAASYAGGLAVAEPQIRAVRQRCREQGWSADRSASAAESELAQIVRQLSGRLV